MQTASGLWRDWLKVVLVRPRNPLNVGAAARAMSNFGFSRLTLVEPYELAFREARSAVGATAVLAEAAVCATVEEAIADCMLVLGTTAARDRDLTIELRALPECGEVIRHALAGGRVAVLFGSEKRGLSNDDLSYCHWAMRIPAREEHSSINLGQAVAVTLYEISRQEPATRTADESVLANMQLVERVTSTVMEVLQRSGYAKAETAGAEEKLRRLVRRQELSAADAEMWLGIWRQVLWKINRE